MRLVVTVLLVVAGARSAAAQPTSSPWWFESVGAGNLIPGCVSGMTLAGFEIDPKGRPALAWREDNGCGGAPRVFWTRFESGSWNQREFLSERRYQGGGAADRYHQFALRKSDGNPFIIYNDAGQWNEINTYRTDLGANPNGGIATYLENVVPPQNCDYANYSLASGDGDVVPQWLRGHSTCNGWGELRLNAVTLMPSVWSARGALAVGADGTRHLLWNSGPEVFYARVPAGAATPDHQVRLFDNINRFGGEIRIAEGPDGTLHAIVKGPDVTADWDLGAIVYLQSADQGMTWSAPQYVDVHDDPAVQSPWNGNSDLSLALDSNGVPAVTFWRWNSELHYARRDGPNGTWTQQLITALPFQLGNGLRTNQLRFDADDRPVVAFFDPVINKMRLARPVPAGVTMPADVSVRLTASPAVAYPGAPGTLTITVTNESAVNLDGIVLSHRLHAGVAMTRTTPPTDTSGRWNITLTSGASQTFVVDVVMPFATGAYVATASATVPDGDAVPGNNAATGSIVVADQACFVPRAPSDGLLGWFRGDGSALNSVAGLEHGSPLNVTYAAGAVGQGFDFNGVNGSVRITQQNDNHYYPGDGSFTVQAYIKTSAAAGYIAARYECVNGWQACTSTRWFLSVTDGRLAWNVGDRNNQYQDVFGTRRVDDGVLHHVAVVLDRVAGETRLYVDGQLDASAPITVGTISESNGQQTSLMIGAYSDYWGVPAGFFTGLIDEFAVHSRALTPSELAGIAAAPLQEACRTQLVIGDDLAVSMTGAPVEIAPTGIITATLAVTNRGPLARANVQLRVSTSAGAWVDAVPEPASMSANTMVVSVGTLAPRETKWVVVRVEAPPVPGPFNLTATHSSGADADSSNNTATATVTVRAEGCFVSPADLVSRWRADGTADDSAGQSHGQLRGATSFEPGRLGQAFRFTAPNDHVEIPDSPLLKPARFTVSAWVYPTAMLDQSWNVMVSKGSSGADPSFPWWGDTFVLGTFWRHPSLVTHHADGNALLIQGPAQLPLHKWSHIAGTFDGVAVRLYVDGVEVAQVAVSHALKYDAFSVPLLIGDDWQSGYANGAPYNGLIDDVMLHARALSAAEIAAAVNGGRSSCNPPQGPVANDDQAATAWKTPVTVDATSNDTGPGGATLTIVAITTPPQHGIATVQNNRIVYTPWAFSGVDTLAYQVSDGQGGTAGASVAITVGAPPPVVPLIVDNLFAHGQLTWSRNIKPAPIASSLQLRFESTLVLPATWPGGLPAAGAQIPNLVGLRINGTDYHDTIPGPFTVVSVNSVNRAVTGTFTVNELVPDSAFPIAVSYDGCCRLSSLQNGNAGTPARLSTVIDLSSATRSPSSSVLPRISATVNGPLMVQLPSNAFDGLTNRFTLATGSGLSTAAPAQFTLSPIGTVTWTPGAPGLHAVQVDVTSVDAAGVARAKAPVEILFDVLPACTQGCPVVTVSIPAPLSRETYPGLETSFDVTVTTSTSGFQSTVITTPLADGMQMRELTPIGQSTIYRVSWTPRPGDPSAFVCFQGRAVSISQSVSSFGQTCATWDVRPSSLRQMTGVLRTFTADHPDMNQPPGAAAPPVFGLDANRKPVVPAGASGATAFGDWFNDLPGANQSSVHSLWLSNAFQPDPGIFGYRSTSWVPDASAQFFTYEVHDTVLYTPGQPFTFKTSGDLWVFVNGGLVVNLHGGAAEQMFTLDLELHAAALSLVPGQRYAVDIFYAHRGTNLATVQLQMNHPQWWEPWFVLDKPSFTEQDVELLGQASVVAGALRLLDPAASGPGAGAAWLRETHDLSRGFRLEFDFVASSPAFEGFAVAIAQAPALGGSADGLGYDGVPHSLAVEFDARRQVALNDPAYPHIAMHTRGAEANSAVEEVPLNISPPSLEVPNTFANASPQHVRIEYQPLPAQATGWLRVWMNDNIRPALEAMVDMARFGGFGVFDPSSPPPAAPEVLLSGARGAIGFTSGRSTGGAVEIRSARLTTVTNTAPSLSFPSSILMIEGRQHVFSIAPADADGDRVIVSLTGALPPGVTFGNDAIAGVPDAGTRGTYPVTLVLTDHLNTTTVEVDVIVNHPPVAVDDVLTVAPGQQIDLAPVLANDLDADAQLKSIVAISDPQHGSLFHPEFDVWLYRARQDQSGTDTFTYTMTDGYETSTATVTVRVVIPNRLPTTNMANLTLLEGEPAIFNIYFNDADHDPITASLTGAPPGVTTTMRAPGDDGLPYYHLRFGGSPSPGSAGTYPVVLTMSDGIDTVTRSYVITVRPPNQAPTASDDAVVAVPWQEVVIPVLANDSDPDGDPLRIVNVTQPQHGSVTMGESEIVYRRASNDGFATDSFTYTIEDAFGKSATARVTVRLLAPGVNLVARSTPVLDVRARQTFDFEMTITNEGSAPTDVVTGEFDRGALAVVVSSVPEQGGQFSIGPLAPGASMRLTFTLLANLNVPSTSALQVTVSSIDEDVSVMADNTTTTSIKVQPDFCFIPQPGLRGFWSGDSWQGEPSIGTSYGPPDAFAPSRVGGAFLLNGDYYQSGHFSAGWPLPRVFTVAAWANLDPAAKTMAPVVMVGGSSWSGVEARYWLGFEDGYPVLMMYEGWDRVGRLRAASPVAPSTWVHLAATYDGVTARLYVNGVEAAAEAVEVSWQDAGFGYIGSSMVGGDAGAEAAFTGLIDDLAIYERVLAGDDIRRMLNGSLMCSPPASPALSVALTATPNPTGLNSVVTMTATVTNTSEGYLDGIVLRAELDELLQLWSAVPPESSPALWNLPPLMPGESATLTAALTTPVVDGQFPMNITASYEGTSASASLMVTAVPDSCVDESGVIAPDCDVNDRPVVQSPGNQVSRVGDVVALTISATDADGGDQLTYSATGLPEGMAIDPQTGAITGAILAAGSGPRRVTVLASDGRLTGGASFDWTVPHRLSLSVGRGATVYVNESSCDARSAARQCVFEFDHGALLDVTVELDPAIGAAEYRWNGDALVQRPEVLRSISAELLVLKQFTVVIDHPASFFSPDALRSSVPILLGAYNLFSASQPEFLACSESESGNWSCAGRAAAFSTVVLDGLDDAFALFDRFSGSCTGTVCAFTLDGERTVTMHYRRRPVNVSLQPGPNATMRLEDSTTGTTFTCNTQPECVVPVPYGHQVRVSNATPGGWLHWQWLSSSGQSHVNDQPAVFTVYGDTWISMRLRAAFTVQISGRPWDGTGLPPVVRGSTSSGELFNLSCRPGDPVVCAATVEAFSRASVYAPSVQHSAGWTGCASESNASWCYIDATTPTQTITLQYGVRLTVQVGPGGRAEVGEVVCQGGTTGATCERLLPIGASVRLRAVPADPTHRQAWTNQAGQHSADAEFFTTMNDTQRYTLTFIVPFTVRRSGVGTVAAVLPASPHAYFVGPDQDRWDGGAPFGSTVTLTTTAGPQHGFAGWSGACGGNAACVLDLQSAAPDITARFATIIVVNVAEHITVTDVMTVRPAVRVLVQETITVTDAVTSQLSNTPAGTNVAVIATGPAGTTSAVSLTFAGVTRPGETSYNVERRYAPPDGFRFGDPPVQFDIVTTAAYTAPVRVCLSYPAGSAFNPSALRLFHYEGNRWVDRTVTVDTTNRVVCGSVSSLSPFALAEPIAIEGRMHGDGEITADGRDYRFEFRIDERRLDRERGWFRLTVVEPRRGKKGGDVQHFKATEIEEIFFWDDPAFRPGRSKKVRPAADAAVFIGTGRWNGRGGYSFEVRAEDHGEPGRGRDRFVVTITDASGQVVAEGSGTLTSGNVQSERLSREHWR